MRRPHFHGMSVLADLPGWDLAAVPAAVLAGSDQQFEDLALARWGSDFEPLAALFEVVAAEQRVAPPAAAFGVEEFREQPVASLAAMLEEQRAAPLEVVVATADLLSRCVRYDSSLQTYVTLRFPRNGLSHIPIIPDSARKMRSSAQLIEQSRDSYMFYA